MKFEFPDFAIVQEGWLRHARPANVFVNVSPNESRPSPGARVIIETRHARPSDRFQYLEVWCRYAPRIDIGASAALHKIGKLVMRKNSYPASSIAEPDGEPMWRLGAPSGVELHNNDEVGELLLSLAKDL